jgi:hypothetical protein
VPLVPRFDPVERNAVARPTLRGGFLRRSSSLTVTALADWRRPAGARQVTNVSAETQGGLTRPLSPRIVYAVDLAKEASDLASVPDRELELAGPKLKSRREMPAAMVGVATESGPPQCRQLTRYRGAGLEPPST